MVICGSDDGILDTTPKIQYSVDEAECLRLLRVEYGSGEDARGILLDSRAAGFHVLVELLDSV